MDATVSDKTRELPAESGVDDQRLVHARKYRSMLGLSGLLALTAMGRVGLDGEFYDCGFRMMGKRRGGGRNVVKNPTGAGIAIDGEHGPMSRAKLKRLKNGRKPRRKR